MFEHLFKWSPDQPRDDNGRWSGGGIGSAVRDLASEFRRERRKGVVTEKLKSLAKDIDKLPVKDKAHVRMLAMGSLTVGDAESYLQMSRAKTTKLLNTLVEEGKAEIDRVTALEARNWLQPGKLQRKKTVYRPTNPLE